MGLLDGKVALISGGARGQGAAEANLFAREGAKVVFGDVLDDQGKQVEAEIHEVGGEALYIHLDVTREADWVSAVETAVSRYGKLDILVNNAGITIRKNVEDTTEEDWDRIISINLKGVWLGMKYQIIQMLEQGGGAIVNTASVAGLVAIRGTCAYVASKHAVAGLTKAAALEYAQSGIRVNAVCPGYIRTPLTQPLFDTMEGFEDQAVARHPLGRLGEPHEIAEAVAWLSSDAASFVTGHTMTVDGGYVAQ